MKFPLLFFVLTLIACGKVVNTPVDDSYELKYNYRLLKLYFYQPEKIKDFSAYEDMEVKSMYEDLNDTLKGYKYTRYYPPDTAEQVISGIENSYRYFSFGFERFLRRDTLLKTDTLIVSYVYPNSPANTAGLKKRDRLLFADNKPLTDEAAAAYLKNDSLFNTTTVFKVLRGDSPLTLPAMKKEEVPEPTVYLDSLEGIPFITITEFTIKTNDPNGTYKEFKNALKEIKNTKTAIIDLRYNPGGSISHCTAMAAELSPPEKELIYDIQHYEDKNGRGVINTTHHYARDFQETGDGIGIKWILLVNGYSASCAERFAAAVKASRPETQIIGSTTFGKGIGQVYMTTPLEGAAFITFMQTYFPNGKTFHRVGIKPDIEADPSYNKDDIYEAALEAAQNFDLVLAKRFPSNIDANNLPPKRQSTKTEPRTYKKLEDF